VMLPTAHRMRRGEEFDRAVRRGHRAARPTVVMHAVWGDEASSSHPQSGDEAVDDSRTQSIHAAQVGFVVSRAVGSSVVRSTVKRRLRHVMRDRIQLLPAQSLVVLRATPGAAGATSSDLARDIDELIAKVRRKAAAGPRRTSADGDRPRTSGGSR
jgi:ribonuclease P protein component